MRRTAHTGTPPGPTPGSPPRPTSPPTPPEELVRAAVAAWGVDLGRYLAAVESLVAQPGPALRAAETQLDAAVERVWTRGWNPADLVHVARRQRSARHGDLAADRVVADGQRRRQRGQPLHPRWQATLASLEDRRGAGRPPPEARVRLAVELLCLITRLPRIPRTMPPPGQAGGSTRTGPAEPRMLARVRALLAKAESTLFEAEAEAFTAKAQELIARHAIDEALLHTADDVGEPSVRRLLVDDPYADAKAYLVAEVADANRCRVVHAQDLGWVTAFGYDHDLDAVELLATSLLAQATAAMVRHGPRRDASGRSRTRSFRRAFLLGFGHRIGERLRAATDAQMATADAGQLVPVLAARDERIRTALAAAFQDVVHRSTSASNPTGWYAGRAAAEVAVLDVSPRRLHPPRG